MEKGSWFKSKTRDEKTRRQEEPTVRSRKQQGDRDQKQEPTTQKMTTNTFPGHMVES